TSRNRYWSPGSAMDSATRGSRLRLANFCRVRVCVMRIRDPSQANHMTLLCGDPSGRTVARCANTGFSSRSMWLAGTSDTGLSSLASTVIALSVPSYQPPRARPSPGKDDPLGAVGQLAERVQVPGVGGRLGDHVQDDLAQRPGREVLEEVG